MKTALIILISLAASLATTLAKAEVFKCVDSAGRVVFSDQACPHGSQSTRVEIPKLPPPAPAATPAATSTTTSESTRPRSPEKIPAAPGKSGGTQPPIY